MKLEIIRTAVPMSQQLRDLYAACFPTRKFEGDWAQRSCHALLLRGDNNEIFGVVQFGDEWVGWLAVDQTYTELGYGRLLARTALRLAGHHPNVIVHPSQGERDESKFWRNVRKGLW